MSGRTTGPTLKDLGRTVGLNVTGTRRPYVGANASLNGHDLPNGYVRPCHLLGRW